MSGRLSADIAIAERADENFVVHATWAVDRTPGMESRVTERLVIADSGLPCDTFNFVCRARLEPEAAEESASVAVAYFAERRRPFSWWVGPADKPSELGVILERIGLQRAESELAMALRLDELPGDIRPVAGLEVRRVSSSAELATFAELSAANWTPPDQEVITFYQRAAAALLAADSPQWLYIGFLDGEPVATAEATVGQGTAGLYNISTLPRVRGRGIGSQLTWRPLQEARRQGCELGVLQAAPDGVSIYRRLGFTEFGHITEYKPRAAGRAAEII